MTACVNKNHGRRVAGVVTASLVGALTLGGVSLAAVPTVALAEQGAELASVGTLDSATATRAKDGRGKDITVPGDNKVVTFEAGKGQWLRIAELTDGANKKYDLLKDASDYQVTYTKESGSASFTAVSNTGDDFTAVANAFAAAATADGNLYKVTVKYSGAASDGPTGTYVAYFKYAKASLDGVKLYEKQTDGNDTSDTTFTYDGTQLDTNFGVADADGVATWYNTRTNPSGSGKYAVTFYNARSPHAGNEVNHVVDAGDYTALVKDTATGESVYVPFTVGQLDLASAGLDHADETSADAPNSATDFLNDVKLGSAAGAIDVSVKAPNGAIDFGNGSGKYEVTLSAKKGSDNVTGTATVSYYVVDTAVTSFLYGSDPLADKTFSKADGESFDASKFKADWNGETLKGDKLSVSYKNAKTGKAVEEGALQEDGTYEITVSVVPFQDAKTGQWVGGTSTTVKYTVKKGITLDANKRLTFKYDGKVVSGTTHPTYTGDDLLKALSVSVTDEDGNELEQGKDFELEVKKGADSVDSIVDVDDYVVTVKGLTFDWKNPSNETDYQLKVNVQKANASLLHDFVASYDTNKILVDQQDALDYTAEDQSAPTAKYEVKKDSKGKSVWGVMPADSYEVASIVNAKGETVKALNAAGVYTVNVKLTDKGSKNFNLTDADFKVEVVSYNPFADVESPAWYAKPVWQALQNSYVHGIGNSKVFAPVANITRADATVILFNMAGGDQKYNDDDFAHSDDKGYVTGFSDVDGHAYYAKALAWAKSIDIAHGYGDGSFAPNSQITREEFAALVANYAKATGKYVAPESDELSKFSDAGTVSDWAKDVVNWAVANKVMGNGGFVAGQASITRAEVATMAVNYQPEKLK